jgi:transposase
MKRTTSITDRQFEELTELVFQELAGTADGGRVLVLTLHDQVRLAVSYLRVNVSQAFLGQIFGVSQSTASRVITALTPILAKALKGLIPDPEQASKGTTLLIDGTLLPCWSWQDAPELYSGKHHTTGHNAQVVSDLTGRLIYLSAPLPGNTHDTNAMRQLDLATLLTSISTGNAIGDKGYQGCNIITPAKKPQGRELTDDRKANNTIINRMRATIERVIANIKTWRILHTDYRRPRKTFQTTLDAVRGLIFFQQSTPL